MKIDFFNTCNGMDPRAINHGVYMIELLEKKESVCLYIGGAGDRRQVHHLL